jgi:hypothetical protein
LTSLLKGADGHVHGHGDDHGYGDGDGHGYGCDEIVKSGIL